MSNEIWKDIKYYEGIYQISNIGRVKRLKRSLKRKDGKMYSVKEKILKTSYDRDGYLFITLRKDEKHKGFRVHRLVAQAFISNITSKETINHLNGIKDDNRVENLEWCTRSENNKHARKNGLNEVKGERCHLSKVTENEVYIIKGLLKHTTLSQKEIAKIFNVDQTNISCIKNNKTWKHIKLEDI